MPHRVPISLALTCTGLDITGEVKSWLEENWDPDLTVREWWELLGTAGLVGADVAGRVVRAGRFARGRHPGDAGHRRGRACSARRAGSACCSRGPRSGCTAPTSRRSVTSATSSPGTKAWCQLFSEPGAGSDLAGLTTTAVRDGDEWVVNGQKVWTSGAQVADLGMLLARTNADVPKHQGISYFAFDMNQPGVEVRPLKEMTGRALFNEVFLTDVRVRDDDAIGGINNGWAVANTTLAFERAGLGAGAGGGGAFGATPGSKAGALDRKVSEFVRPRTGAGASSPGLRRERGAAGAACTRQRHDHRSRRFART